MGRQDLKYKEISECKGVITNIDDHDLSEDFFIRARGLRRAVPSKIAERDFGTIHRYATNKYPTTNLTPSTLVILAGTSIYDATEVSSSKEIDFIAGTDKDNKLHVYVWNTTTNLFMELTRVITALAAEAPTADQLDILLDTFVENGIALAAPANSELIGYIAYNSRLSFGIADPSAVFITGNTAGRIFCDGKFGLNGMDWHDNDPITIYRGAGLWQSAYTGSYGATPQIRWLETDAQRKVAMFYCNPATQTRNQPLLFMKRDARKLGVYTVGGLNYVNFPAQWWTEGGGGLCTYFKQFGDKAGLIVDTSVHNTLADYPLDSWISFDAIQVAGPAQPNTNVYAYMLVTVTYDNYQESDPVFGFFCGYQPVSKIQIQMNAKVNPGLMPNNVTGLRVYVWHKWFVGASAGEIQAEIDAVTSADLTLARTIKFNEFNTPADVTVYKDINDVRGRIVGFNYIFDTTVARESTDTLDGSLSHAWSKTRSVIKPRFVARATRTQGAVIVCDTDDNTVRLSSYDGAAAHEDDNFPNVSVDNNDFKQKVALSSHGELLGLAIQTDMLMAFKPAELEFADFQSGLVNRTVQADVLAKDSIITTPFGVCWAGNSAIYWYPENGGGVQILNQEWKNFWDGTLAATNGTPFMSLIQRQATIAGYDPTYQCVWFQTLCADEAGTGTEYICWWYSFIHKHWFVRKLALGSSFVRFFARRTDSMTIGFSAGLLKYPYTTGAGRYKDAVLTDLSGGTAFEVKGVINFGSLYNLVKNQVPVQVLVDHATGGTGVFHVRFYANHDSTAFDDKTLPVSNYGVFPRQIQVRGMLERLKMEFEVTGGNLDSITDFEINTIEFGFVPRQRIGNR